MKRNNAADFYFFSDSFFSSLYNRLRDNLSINVIQKDSKIVSADLYLITKKICYGFISGTKTEYYQYSPNSLLRFESIKRFKELGLSYYSIGGGLAQNDSIYKYKKAFSKDQESKFYIGKIIHNEEIYNNVISQWELRSKNNENLKLLRYRDV
jgi:lipid II:glycine glycyltransferase (peptidoglycan interpeptide bridge formation enzyme)